VRVVVVEAGASEEAEEEVAGGDEEVDLSTPRTCIPIHQVLVLSPTTTKSPKSSSLL
jgi:hypothetical protein